METLPTGTEKRRQVRVMFDSIAPRYDMVNRLMTFGLDTAWRSRAITLLGLRPHARVLDLACGTGDLARELADRSYRAVGLDYSAGMLAHARSGGAPLVLGDAAALPLRSAGFDGAVSGFALRNFADLPAAFAELGRVLRPQGRLCLLEVCEPTSPVLRAGHAMWFRGAVPLLGGILSDGGAYRYLPRSVAYLPDWEELRQMIEDAGFAEVRQHRLSGGVVQIVSATRRGLPEWKRAGV